MSSQEEKFLSYNKYISNYIGEVGKQMVKNLDEKIMREAGLCVRCDDEFEGKGTQKYCSDECRELMGVERKLDYGRNVLFNMDEVERIVHTCDGKCCKAGEMNVARTSKGWIFIQKKGIGVRAGQNIAYCPFCGGRLG